MPSLVDDSPKTSTLPGPKMSAGSPVERGPVDAQAQIAFALRGEAADRGAVEGQIVRRLSRNFLS